MREIRIGTSGWSYDHWDTALYHPKLPVAKRLSRYVAEFDTVELNASFYRWPKAQTFEGWHDRLAYFLGCLPDWMRVAVELRHPTWNAEPVFELMARHRANYVVMSGAGLPCVPRATSSTVYVRLHGPDDDHLYAGSYPDADLQWWAERMLEWRSQDHDVVVYFNNDGHGHAVRNARRLRELVEQG